MKNLIVTLALILVAGINLDANAQNSGFAAANSNFEASHFGNSSFSDVSVQGDILTIMVTASGDGIAITSNELIRTVFITRHIRTGDSEHK